MSGWIISGAPHVGQIRQPKTFYLTDFTESALRSFQITITECLNSGQGVLPIYIESGGGSVNVLSGFISAMAGARKDGMAFATIVNGFAASAGALVWCFGNDGLRYCGEQASIMLHGMQIGQAGKISDVKDTVNVYLTEQESLFEKISKNLKKPKGWLSTGMKKRQNSDWYLTADDIEKEKLGKKHNPKFIFSLHEQFNVV